MQAARLERKSRVHELLAKALGCICIAAMKGLRIYMHRGLDLKRSFGAMSPLPINLQEITFQCSFMLPCLHQERPITSDHITMEHEHWKPFTSYCHQ